MLGSQCSPHYGNKANSKKYFLMDDGIKGRKKEEILKSDFSCYSLTSLSPIQFILLTVLTENPGGSSDPSCRVQGLIY